MVISVDLSNKQFKRLLNLASKARRSGDGKVCDFLSLMIDSYQESCSHPEAENKYYPWCKRCNKRL